MVNPTTDHTPFLQFYHLGGMKKHAQEIVFWQGDRKKKSVGFANMMKHGISQDCLECAAASMMG